MFMWRHFHIYLPHDYDDDDALSGSDESAEDEHVELHLERVQTEQQLVPQHNKNNIETESESDNNDNEFEVEKNEDIWLTKLQSIIHYMRYVSFDIIHVLGTILSLDEMMIQFMGKSVETHRIKNKSIEEGYNFFVHIY